VFGAGGGRLDEQCCSTRQDVGVVVAPRTGYATSDGLSIGYRVLGEGPPDVVCVAGWLTHLDVMWEDVGFRHFATRLSQFSRLILFDKRGVGLSDRLPPGEMPALEERIDDVRAVMGAVGSTSAYLLAVHEAGPMCLLFAATDPELVAGLVLYGTWATGTWREDYPWAPSPADHDRLSRVITERWGTGIGISNYAPSLLGDESFRQWQARVERAGATPATARALAEAMAATDVRHVLAAIGVPTLVVHRATDRLVDPGNARYLAGHIAGARLVMLPSGDHWVGVDSDQIVDVIEEFVSGARATPAAERVLATIMFSDIEGSTALGRQFGDHRMRQLLDRHDEIAAELVGRYRGRIVNTLGDGILAVFDGPARGVRCALDFVEMVRTHLDLTVRAGIHVGEVEARGSDVTGLAVNLAARIANIAAGGEVLVSRTIVDLVAGSDLDFEDLGQHPLKGLPGSQQLFSAR
jgi:class 3 adenylate cyclase